MEQSLKKERMALERDPIGPSKEEQQKEEEERFKQILELSQHSLGVSQATVTPLRNILPYRLPRCGDLVELCGLRRRQELNGQQGEVVGPLTDEGFVQVQLMSSKEDAGGVPVLGAKLAPRSGACSVLTLFGLETKKGLVGERLMLRPRCLAPADEKTLEPLKWSPSEASSVRTMSLAASKAASEVASVLRSETSARSMRSRSSGSLRSAKYTSSNYTDSYTESYTRSYTGTSTSASSHRKLPSIWLKQRSKDSLNYIPTKVII